MALADDLRLVRRSTARLTLATALAAYLIDVAWVKLVGAAYLLYLPYTHFFQGNDEGGDRRQHKPARTWLGLSAFWATVVKVELTDGAWAADAVTETLDRTALATLAAGDRVNLERPVTVADRQTTPDAPAKTAAAPSSRH